MNRTAKLSIGLLICFVIFYIIYQVGFSHYITLQNIKAHSTHLYAWVGQHYLISLLVYTIMFFMVIALSLPATPVLGMAGGFLFGIKTTVFIATIAATAGAALSFLLFKSASQSTLQKKYKTQFAAFEKGLHEYGAFYLLIVHFMIVVPFFVINALAALANVSLWRFIWTTAVGFLPGITIYAFAGKQLMSMRSVYDVFSWNIIVALLLLIGMMILPMIYKRYKKR